jgi:hypothetical protein
MIARKATELVPTMLRIRESLRKRLERAAKSNAVSINQEITTRLERTFTQDEEIEAQTEKMEEREAELREMYREHIEEQARKEADLAAALRDTKILNMMVENQYPGGMLLRSVAREITDQPNWAETAETRQAFAEKLHWIITNNLFTGGLK